MKKSFWLLTAVALLAGSGVIHADEALSLIRPPAPRPADNIGGTQVRSLPRLLGGSGWQTTIVLMNLGSTAVAFHQSFLDNNGKPAAFSVSLPANNTSLLTSALQGMIAPSGTVSFTLTSDSSSAQEGWSLLTFDGLQNQLNGYAILRHAAAAGGFNFEATLPLDNMLDSSARMPFDNTGGFQTQLTIVNPASNLTAQVQLTYFNAQGQVILLDSVALNPGAQTTLTLPNTYPDLANQAGSIAIVANINCLSVTGVRFNPTSGAVTALPVMDFAPGISLQ